MKCHQFTRSVLFNYFIYQFNVSTYSERRDKTDFFNSYSIQKKRNMLQVEPFTTNIKVINNCQFLDSILSKELEFNRRDFSYKYTIHGQHLLMNQRHVLNVFKLPFSLCDTSVMTSNLRAKFCVFYLFRVSLFLAPSLDGHLI